MAIGRTAWTDDDGSGTTGTILNNAQKTALYDQIDALIGEWTSVTFSAGNYTASTGSWTLTSGDQAMSRYLKIGKLLFWEVVLTTTTISATPSSLRIACPTGTFATTNNYTRNAFCLDNGAQRDCMINPFDSTHIQIRPVDLGNFATSTNATDIYFQGFFELT